MSFAGGPIKGVTITPQRPNSDGLGNLTFADQAAIQDAVFALDAPTSVSDSVYSQSGSLFVPRGSDLRNGDRIPYGTRFFVVIGPVQWDMDHPMTSEDFGYVEVRIQWGG